MIIEEKNRKAIEYDSKKRLACSIETTTMYRRWCGAAVPIICVIAPAFQSHKQEPRQCHGSRLTSINFRMDLHQVCHSPFLVWGIRIN